MIQTIAPKREVGKNYLMIDEDMWVFIPKISRSVRVALNQKLSGQTSYGDISRMRWYGDYKPKIEKETDTHWVLYLKARKKGLTYAKMRIWINKKNYHPEKGEYMAKSGRLLKKVSFTGYRKIAGKIRPTTIRIENAKNKEEYSILKIAEMQIANAPESLFVQANLK